MKIEALISLLAYTVGKTGSVSAFIPATAPCINEPRSSTALEVSRRSILLDTAAGAAAASLSLTAAVPSRANAAAAVQDSLQIDDFLRTGIDSGGTMGVSSQAGKSRPQTGVVFRDGTDVLQGRNGDVSAEILVGTKANPTSVLVSFSAPYKLEKGGVFDIECRDGKTGDGSFVAVTQSTNGKSIGDLPSAFFLERLFDPTGRFSFYGPPTDVKVKKSSISDDGERRFIELSFSNLSQSTNAEIPRNALLVATIPNGTDNAVMLVTSSNSGRWRKGADTTAKVIAESYRALPAPKTSMKLRAKDRSGGTSLDF
mmetsp:Transcript_35851/g.81884  ORF Transcript_35851/g.81884 Transcript_35851/m.81884 type:complete len:313 (+) Transcript_35851:23-961(+)